MCGGFRPSRKLAIAKENQINAEMQRLANLKKGFPYTWPTSQGLITAHFGGHVRSESMESGVWEGKIAQHVTIEAESFAERDTVAGTYEFKHFKVPDGYGIAAVILNDGYLRIVTQPATVNVAKVHHRQPYLCELS